MKRVKKLTYNERKIAESWGLDADKWGREKFVNGCLILYHMETGEQKQIPAKVKAR